jgi:hypothetical protein
MSVPGTRNIISSDGDYCIAIRLLIAFHNNWMLRIPYTSNLLFRFCDVYRTSQCGEMRSLRRAGGAPPPRACNLQLARPSAAHKAADEWDMRVSVVRKAGIQPTNPARKVTTYANNIWLYFDENCDNYWIFIFGRPNNSQLFIVRVFRVSCSNCLRYFWFNRY